MGAARAYSDFNIWGALMAEPVAVSRLFADGREEPWSRVVAPQAPAYVLEMLGRGSREGQPQTTAVRLRMRDGGLVVVRPRAAR